MAFRTEDRFLYIQFRTHLNRVNVDKLLREEKEDLRLEVVADYREEEVDLPFGMCPFLETEGRQFLVGGERLRKDDPFGFYVLEWELSKSSDGLSSDIFVLDPSTGKITIDHGFPKPNAPKTKAKVLYRDCHEIYVLAFEGYCYFDVLPDPAFECYDVAENIWKALPAPPNYFDNDRETRHLASTYCYHFVVGRKIYLCTLEAVSCFDMDEPAKGWEWIVDSVWSFDVRTTKWYVKPKFDINDNVPLPPAFPYRSLAFSDSISRGCYTGVGYTLQGLVAYGIGREGNLLAQRVLQRYNCVLPCPNEECGGRVVHLGGAMFSLILSGRMGDNDYDSLGVAIFEVEFIPDGTEFDFSLPRIHYHTFDDINSLCTIRSLKQFLLGIQKRTTLYDYSEVPDAFLMYAETGPYNVMAKRPRLM